MKRKNERKKNSIESVPHFLSFRFLCVCFFSGRHIIWLRYFSLHLWLISLFVFFSYQQTVKMSWNDDYFFVVIHREMVFLLFILMKEKERVCVFAYLAFSLAFNSFFSVCSLPFLSKYTISCFYYKRFTMNERKKKAFLFLPFASIWGIFELFSQSVFFLFSSSSSSFTAPFVHFVRQGFFSLQFFFLSFIFLLLWFVCYIKRTKARLEVCCIKRREE